MANDYLAKNFDGRTFAQLKEKEALDIMPAEEMEQMLSFRDFYRQEIKITPVPMSDLKSANIEPVVLKILSEKILVED
jgi:hypothetical protein